MCGSVLTQHTSSGMLFVFTTNVSLSIISEVLPVCAYNYISKRIMYYPTQEDLSVAPNFSLQHNIVHIMAVAPAHSASSVGCCNDSSQQAACPLNAYLLLFV